MILVNGSLSQPRNKHHGALYGIEGGDVSKIVELPGSSIYGTVRYGDYFYSSIRNEIPSVIMMDSSFKILKAVPLLSSADVHSIFVYQDKLNIMSSAEDRVYSFELGTLNSLGYKSFGEGDTKRYHLNDVIVVQENTLIMSMFRGWINPLIKCKDKVPQGVIKMGSAVDPASSETILEDLIQPHSPFIFKGVIYVCDSARGRVLCGNTVIYEETAWVRGLVVNEEGIYIGTSLPTNRTGPYNSSVIKISHNGEKLERFEVPFNNLYSLTEV